MKICSKCGELKSKNAFSNDKRQKSGLYPSCKQCKDTVRKKYYKAHCEEIIKQDIKRHLHKYNTDEQYRRAHNNKCAKWNKANPRPEYHRKYNKQRYHTDIQFRLACNLRNRLNCVTKYQGKQVSAVRDLGCTVLELRQHLEAQFNDGMSWDNYGRIDGIKCWEIDHIIPLAKIDLTNPKELRKVCHYTNLQPLWAEDNLAKSNKIE